MKNIEVLKLVKELQKESIEFKDIFGIHKGVIHELKVKDNDIDRYLFLFKKVIPVLDREELSEKTYNYVISRFDVSVMQRSYENFYRDNL